MAPPPPPPLREDYVEGFLTANNLAAEGRDESAYEVLLLSLAAFRRRHSEGELLAIPAWQASAQSAESPRAGLPASGYLVQRMGYDRVDRQFSVYVWPSEPVVFYVRQHGTTYGSTELALCHCYDGRAARDQALGELLCRPAPADLHHVPLDPTWWLVAADPRTRRAVAGSFGRARKLDSPATLAGDDLKCLTDLAERDNLNAVEALLRALEAPAVPVARRLAVWQGLLRSKLGTTRLQARFRAQADHADPTVRQAARQALESLESISRVVGRRRRENDAIASLMDAHH